MSEKLAPIHPGEVLREEFMLPLGLSSNALARALGVTAARISEIVREERGITADTALRLARYFGTSEDLWLNLQRRYESSAHAMRWVLRWTRSCRCGRRRKGCWQLKKSGVEPRFLSDKSFYQERYGMKPSASLEANRDLIRRVVALHRGQQSARVRLGGPW